MFRWALLDLRTCYSANTLYLWALTDQLTHLILRWTSRPPLVRKTWPERRGLPHEYRDKYLDAPWNSIDQTEPDIQTQKTFIWPAWPPNTPYWYIFTHVFGYYQPASHSPLFHYISPADPTWTPVFIETWTS